MPELPDYALRNRDYWTRTQADWIEPGRRAWAKDEIDWGIWGVPESEVRAFGDLGELRGKDVIELGCGTGYFSAWMAKHGARPVGVDITPAQLDCARGFQREFGLEFPLIECSAEEVPLPDASFDVAISEYGASIWCDPYRWIPEAARLLRPGGTLVFLRNSTISMCCAPDTGPAQESLCRDWFGLYRLEWVGDEGVEFHLPTGPMLRLLRETGFEVEDLIELRAPEIEPDVKWEYMTHAWARRWPCEEIWRARKR